MKRLLIRGGSIAAGHGVDKGYGHMVADGLREIGFEVVNRSRYRDTTFDGIWNFHEDIERLEPDILLLNFGMDDAFHPVYRSEYKENLVQIIRLAKNRLSAEVLLLTSHTMRSIHDTDYIMIYNRVMREVAIDLDCRLLPLHTYWAGLILDNTYTIDDILQEDDRYPNENGHAIYAEMIIRNI